MLNKIINFELAKLLKEKGFNEPCDNHYSQALFEGTNPDWEGVFPKYYVFKHSNYYYNSKPNNNDLWFECSAPTIAHVLDWLYKEHGIWVFILPQDKSSVDYRTNSKFPSLPLFVVIIRYKEDLFVEELLNTSDSNSEMFLHFDEPTEAYEEAINYILNTLI